MALKNAKVEKKHGVGYYVAYRREAKKYCCVSEKHYNNYGVEYERGQFYHDYMDAAKATDVLNHGEDFEVPENSVIIVNPKEPEVSLQRSNELSLETVSNEPEPLVTETKVPGKRAVKFKE